MFNPGDEVRVIDASCTLVNVGDVGKVTRTEHFVEVDIEEGDRTVHQYFRANQLAKIMDDIKKGDAVILTPAGRTVCHTAPVGARFEVMEIPNSAAYGPYYRLSYNGQNKGLFRRTEFEPAGLTLDDLTTGTEVEIVAAHDVNRKYSVGDKGTIVRPIAPPTGKVWVHVPGKITEGHGVSYRPDQLRVVETTPVDTRKIALERLEKAGVAAEGELKFQFLALAVMLGTDTSENADNVLAALGA